MQPPNRTPGCHAVIKFTYARFSTAYQGSVTGKKEVLSFPFTAKSLKTQDWLQQFMHNWTFLLHSKADCNFFVLQLILQLTT